jgi:hypothetical protein
VFLRLEHPPMTEMKTCCEVVPLFLVSRGVFVYWSRPVQAGTKRVCSFIGTDHFILVRTGPE